MLIDAHCHLDDERLFPELSMAIERARLAGVEKVITIGTDAVSSRNAHEIAQKYPGIVYHTVGAHPSDASRFTEDQILEIELLARETQPVAIGEIGLDYHHDADPKDQLKLFVRMLALARSLNLPVVIHDRDAHDDLYQCLKDHAMGMKIMLHCYSAGAEQVERFLRLGCLFSFAGPLTFKNGQSARDALLAVLIERIVVETDAPWLAPDPHRGQRNEPAYVRLVAQKAALLKGIPEDEFARITTNTACSFYGISNL